MFLNKTGFIPGAGFILYAIFKAILYQIFHWYETVNAIRLYIFTFQFNGYLPKYCNQCRENNISQAKRTVGGNKNNPCICTCYSL